MPLESWEYGDPETVAVRREEEELRKEKACGKCKYKVSMEWKGKMYHGCEFKRRQYGTRCQLYKVKKDETT